MLVSVIVGAYENYASLDEFLRRWTQADKKAAIIEELQEQGVLIEALLCQLCPCDLADGFKQTC